MAGRAIREVVLLNVSSRESLLPDMRILGRRPIHLINLTRVAEFTVGISMAGEAPAHGHVGRLPSDRHFIDPAVARRAADSLVDMNGVIEINVTRHFVDRIPLDRFVLGIALTHRREHGRVLPHLGMARHAGLRIRHARVRGGRDRGMAKAAIDAEFTRVMLMAERDRLVQRHADVGPIRRSVEQVERVETSHHNHERARQEKFGIEVDRGWEELGHNSIPPAAAQSARL